MSRSAGPEYNTQVIRRPTLALALLAVVLAAVAAHGARPITAPSADELGRLVHELTTPEMDGRRSGTPGGDLAARRLAEWLAAAGLRPGGDDGTWFQSFVLSPGTRVAADSLLEAAAPATRRFELGRDWTPHGGSMARDVTGEIVFVGHGISALEQGWDEWAGVDVRDRIAVVLDGVPEHLPGVRSSRLEKLIAARRHGARAVLVVDDRLPALAATAAAVGIVSAAITEPAADALLAPAGATVAERATAIAERRAPAPLLVPGRVRLRVDLADAARTAVNVVGVLPGVDPDLASEAIVLGAHYDHLGTVRDETYHGADDNGSGTALVVGLARALAEAGGAPRTLVFVLFGAEEIGLVGSAHYVRRAATPIERTAAMLNFDMVGRLRDGRLTIGGVDSGHGLRAAVEGATRAAALPATLRGLPWGPSDHSRFYSAGAPVLFFHTGIHPDYHRPTDTAGRIDAAGMARIAAVAADVTSRLAAGERPAWVAHAPRRPGRERGAAPVVLGVAADGREESDGVRLAQVLPGSAADRAGLREGDVLVRVGGAVMNGFDDLRSTLRGRRPGDSLPILYLRNGEDHETTATLDARS